MKSELANKHIANQICLPIKLPLQWIKSVGFYNIEYNVWDVYIHAPGFSTSNLCASKHSNIILDIHSATAPSKETEVNTGDQETN